MTYNTTDTKAKIKKLEGGKFQSLCIDILHTKYDNIAPVGSHDSSDKTTLGTPDVYICDGDKYILVECTTQDEQICEKIENDLKKCIDRIEKIKANDAEIVFYYSSSNLKIDDDNKLRKLCKPYKLTINSIDDIAWFLQKHPIIAKKHLGIEIDTMQIMYLNDFIDEYNFPKSTVPINPKLLHREEEQTAILNSVLKNDITIISGKPGVGKTHTVLDLLRHKPDAIKEYEILCIKNRGQNLYEDLHKYLDNDNKFLIFIDDINNLSFLQDVLNFVNNGDRIKIIATVRDYAMEKVDNELQNYKEISHIENSIKSIYLNYLNDSQITDIIKENSNITNGKIIHGILSRAHGNIRIIMMILQDAIANNKLSNLNDICSNYYKFVINDLYQKSETIMKSLAIISIFNKVNIENETFNEVRSLYNINISTLKKDFKILNEHELIISCNGSNERLFAISEQCLSEYSLYLSLIINKDIKFEDLIIKLYPTNKKILVNCINNLFVFPTNEMLDLIEKATKYVWDNIDNYGYDKIEFLKTFNRLIEVDCINFCKNYIDNIEECKKIINYEDVFNKKDFNIHNDIISIFVNFKHSSYISNVLDLSFEYLSKDNSIIGDLYLMLSNRFDYKGEQGMNPYETQMLVIDKLHSELKRSPKLDIMYLVLNVCRSYIDTSGNYRERYSERTIVLYTYSLCEDDNLHILRNKIFDLLIELSKHNCMRMDIIKFIKEIYDNYYNINKNFKPIVENDIPKFSELVHALEPFDFMLAYAVNNVYNKYKELNIEYDEIPIAGSTFKVYKSLIKYANCLKEENCTGLKEFVLSLTKDQINEYINEIINLRKLNMEIKDFEIERLTDQFIIVCFENKYINPKELFIICTKEFNEFPILSRVLKECIGKIDDRVLLDILLGTDDSYKFDIIIFYYRLISNKKNYDDYKFMLKFISDSTLSPHYNINWNFLDNYLEFDENIHINLIKTVWNKYKTSIIPLNCCLNGLFIEPKWINSRTLKNMRDDDYNILTDVFLKLKNQDGELIDLDNILFDMLASYKYEPFIDKFVNFLSNNENSENIIEAIYHLWELPGINYKYLIDKIMAQNTHIMQSVLWGILKYNNDENQNKIDVLFNLLEENVENKDIILLLFDIVLDYPKNVRIELTMKFLMENKDIEDFKLLPLYNYCDVWSGSYIPILNDKIEFLKELLDCISKLGIEYIEHTKYINDTIIRMQNNKLEIQEKEFLYE